MSPFQAPEGPFTIESVMESIRAQVVDAPGPGGAAQAGAAPTISDGGERARLLIQINQLADQLYNEPPYRIRSHRKWIGWFPRVTKKLMHWGTRQFVDHHHRRQQAFNETSLQLLRDLLHLIDENERAQPRGMDAVIEGASVRPAAPDPGRREVQELKVESQRAREEIDALKAQLAEWMPSALHQLEEIELMRDLQFDHTRLAQQNRDDIEFLTMNLREALALVRENREAWRKFKLAQDVKSARIALTERGVREAVGQQQAALDSLRRAAEAARGDIDGLLARAAELERRGDANETEIAALVIREQAILRRHDLAPFFDAVPFQRRLEALDHSRGTIEDIRARQALYVPMLTGLPGPVLDVGCGRGEMLDLLDAAGIPAWGAEPDAPMAEIAAERGLDVRRQDMHTALTGVAEGSLGGIFAAQVVEHLFPGELLAFIRLALRKLAPGGRIILETLNPASLGVLAKSYYRDLDHKQPIHPEYLRDLLTLAGFEDVQLEYTAPFREDEKVLPLPAAEEIGLSPAVRDALQDRLDRLDALIHGPQDYHVTGVRGAASEAGA